MRQIVILGAGYDGRALRYRTPGVQFFEVDHPATQTDKRLHLERIDVSVEGIAFVPADLTEPGLATALTGAGFDISAPSQFLCEGLLRYLPERWFRELFVVTAEYAAPTSELAASISTRDGRPLRRRTRTGGRALARAGEAVLTVPRAEVALEWLTAAGWTPLTVEDSARRETDTRRGRLLVRARRTEPGRQALVAADASALRSRRSSSASMLKWPAPKTRDDEREDTEREVQLVAGLPPVALIPFAQVTVMIAIIMSPKIAAPASRVNRPSARAMPPPNSMTPPSTAKSSPGWRCAVFAK